MSRSNETKIVPLTAENLRLALDQGFGVAGGLNFGVLKSKSTGKLSVGICLGDDLSQPAAVVTAEIAAMMAADLLRCALEAGDRREVMTTFDRVMSEPFPDAGQNRGGGAG